MNKGMPPCISQEYNGERAEPSHSCNTTYYTEKQINVFN